MPNISFIDVDIHAAQDSIHALQNTAPDTPLVTLENEHNEALRYLENIFDKSTSPERPRRAVQWEQHQHIIEKRPKKHAEPPRLIII